MSTAPICPQCGMQMKLRRSESGPFWGCSQYPKCNATLDAEEEFEDAEDE